MHSAGLQDFKLMPLSTQLADSVRMYAMLHRVQYVGYGENAPYRQ